MFKNFFFGLFVINLFFATVVFSEGSPAGKIMKVSGIVKLNNKAVQVNDNINEGDYIESDSDSSSFVDIKYENGNFFRLKNGKMRIQKSKDKFKIELKSGSLFVNVEKLTEKQTFNIITPTAVTGVRGTRFQIDATELKTYICVCEGTVWTKKKNFISKLFFKKTAVNADYDLWVNKGKKLKKPKYSPDMIKMTKAIFEDMGLK